MRKACLIKKPSKTILSDLQKFNSRILSLQIKICRRRPGKQVSVHKPALLASVIPRKPHFHHRSPKQGGAVPSRDATWCNIKTINPISDPFRDPFPQVQTHLPTFQKPTWGHMPHSPKTNPKLAETLKPFIIQQAVFCSF